MAGRELFIPGHGGNGGNEACATCIVKLLHLKFTQNSTFVYNVHMIGIVVVVFTAIEQHLSNLMSTLHGPIVVPFVHLTQK